MCRHRRAADVQATRACVIVSGSRPLSKRRRRKERINVSPLSLDPASAMTN